eukprot:4613139-Pyramimonas_sp.AAC.1
MPLDAPPTTIPIVVLNGYLASCGTRVYCGRLSREGHYDGELVSLGHYHLMWTWCPLYNESCQE